MVTGGFTCAFALLNVRVFTTCIKPRPAPGIVGTRFLLEGPPLKKRWAALPHRRAETARSGFALGEIFFERMLCRESRVNDTTTAQNGLVGDQQFPPLGPRSGVADGHFQSG